MANFIHSFMTERSKLDLTTIRLAKNGPDRNNPDIYVDLIPPVAKFLSKLPAQEDKNSELSFTIGGTNVKFYKYKLDDPTGIEDEPEYSIIFPLILTEDVLTMGDHTLYVIGRDANKFNWQVTPTEASWKTIPEDPITKITKNPLGINKNGKLFVVSDYDPLFPITTTSSLFEFVALRNTNKVWDDVTFYIRVDSTDDNDWIPQTEKSKIVTLPDGDHTFEVYAESLYGTRTQTPVKFSWTTITVQPKGIIYGLPTVSSNKTNKTSIDVTIGGIDVVKYRLAWKKAGSNIFMHKDSISIDLIGNTNRTISTFANGDTIEVYIWATNQFGFEQTVPTTYSFIVDTIAPTAIITTTPTIQQKIDGTFTCTTSTNITPTISVSNGGDRYKWRLGNSGDYSSEVMLPNQIPMFTNLSDGEYELYAIAGDEAGNWQNISEPTIYKWKVDTSVPTIALTTPSTSIIRTTSITISIESLTNASSYQYKIEKSVDGGNTYTTHQTSSIITNILPFPTIDITSLPSIDADYKVIAWAFSCAGTRSATDSVVTFTVKTSLPSALFVGTIDTVTRFENQTFNVTVSKGDRFRWRFNGSAPTTALGLSGTFSVILSSGVNTISIEGGDIAGNWQSTPTSITIELDQKVPVIAFGNKFSVPSNTETEITDPVNIPYQKIPITISNYTGAIRYSYYINSNSTQISGPFNYTNSSTVSTSPLLLDGTYNITVTATSRSGVTATATSEDWILDTGVPKATITNTDGISNNGFSNRSSMSFTVSPTDANGGLTQVVAYKYKLNSGNWSAIWTPIATSIILNTLTDGSNTLYVIAKDAAGNEQPTNSLDIATFTWTRDTIAPVTTIWPDYNTIYSSGTSQNVSFTSSDNTAAPVTIYYKINDGTQETYSGTPISILEMTKFEFWGVDAAGNIETHKTVTYLFSSFTQLTNPIGQSWGFGGGGIDITSTDDMFLIVNDYNNANFHKALLFKNISVDFEASTNNATWGAPVVLTTSSFYPIVNSNSIISSPNKTAFCLIGNSDLNCISGSTMIAPFSTPLPNGNVSTYTVSDDFIATSGVYMNGKFVIIGHSYSSGGFKTVSSDNYLNSNACHSTFKPTNSCMSSDNTKIYVIGNEDDAAKISISTSNNGIGFSSPITIVASGFTPRAIKDDGTRLIVIGYNGSGVAYYTISTNSGITWSSLQSLGITIDSLMPVFFVYNNGLYMIACRDTSGTNKLYAAVGTFSNSNLIEVATGIGNYFTSLNYLAGSTNNIKRFVMTNQDSRMYSY